MRILYAMKIFHAKTQSRQERRPLALSAPARLWVRPFLLAAFASQLLASDLFADVFHLETGGQIVGVLVDRGKDGEYVVRNEQGAVVTLDRRQVDKVTAQDPIDLEYAERSRAMPNTVAAHHELAEWCKANKLSKYARHHLAHILELDPNEEQARLALGYQQVRGRWMTRDQIMAARGLRKYDGDYRTPQDIALREQVKAREKAETEWYQDIRRWVRWLDDRRAAEAVELISNIDDPQAAVAIVKLLDKVEDQRIRDLLTATLAELEHPLAVTTLVNFSILEPDPEVRLMCLDYLMRFHQPVPLTPYVSALRDRDNEIVNRAADLLRRLEDTRAISPLIDALVTRHKFKPSDAPIGNMGATFSPNGGAVGGPGGPGGGLSMGGNKNKVIVRDLRNLQARQALVELSGGQDFMFDERLWRRWFVNQRQYEGIDARRDE